MLCVDFRDLESSGGGLALVFRRWATKKTAGSSKNGRDSKPKNLGVKKFGGEVSCFVPSIQNLFFELRFGLNYGLVSDKWEISH